MQLNSINISWEAQLELQQNIKNIIEAEINERGIEESSVIIKEGCEEFHQVKNFLREFLEKSNYPKDVNGVTYVACELRYHYFEFIKLSDLVPVDIFSTTLTTQYNEEIVEQVIPPNIIFEKKNIVLENTDIETVPQARSTTQELSAATRQNIVLKKQTNYPTNTLEIAKMNWEEVGKLHYQSYTVNGKLVEKPTKYLTILNVNNVAMIPLTCRNSSFQIRPDGYIESESSSCHVKEFGLQLLDNSIHIGIPLHLVKGYIRTKKEDSTNHS